MTDEQMETILKALKEQKKMIRSIYIFTQLISLLVILSIVVVACQALLP